jgi:hypothetical protein
MTNSCLNLSHNIDKVPITSTRKEMPMSHLPVTIIIGRHTWTKITKHFCLQLTQISRERNVIYIVSHLYKTYTLPFEEYIHYFTTKVFNYKKYNKIKLHNYINIKYVKFI